MANQYTKKYTLENIKAPKDIWRRINRAITKHPELHDQRAWHATRKGTEVEDVYTLEEAASCGTSHCVAGWGCVLTPGGLKVEYAGNGRSRYGTQDVFEVALRNAGHDDDFISAQCKLFYNMNKDDVAAKVAALARQEARNEKNAKLRAKRRAAKRAGK